VLGALDLREPWSSDGELAEGRYEGQLLDSNLRAECVGPGPQGIHVHQAAPHPQNLGELALIVGLNVALKGPFPLVGESELSRESEMSRFGLF
jgi:hypothetical protein